MCASCGCNKPEDNHGDSANITVSDMKRAADAAGISPMQVADNLRASVS